jgi:cell division protein FtsB
MKPKAKRALVAAGILAFALFAVQGGEYGTLDLVRQRAAKERTTAAIDSLTRIVDSLTKYKKRLATDQKLLEKLAREQFGMVRDGEVLYRFVER